MRRYEEDRNLIRKRWFQEYRSLTKYFYPNLLDWPCTITQPNRWRKRHWKRHDYCGRPPKDLRRIWSKKMRQDFRQALFHEHDLSEFYFSSNHRHWGLWEWL
jgi:hypothetical protein